MSCKGRAGPVEPATVAKVEAPLEEGCVDGLAPRSEFPGPIPAPQIGIIKKGKLQDIKKHASRPCKATRETFLKGPLSGDPDPARLWFGPNEPKSSKNIRNLKSLQSVQ